MVKLSVYTMFHQLITELKEIFRFIKTTISDMQSRVIIQEHFPLNITRVDKESSTQLSRHFRHVIACAPHSI